MSSGAERGAADAVLVWELVEEGPNGEGAQQITTGDEAGMKWLASITIPKGNNRIVVRPLKAEAT